MPTSIDPPTDRVGQFTSEPVPKGVLDAQHRQLTVMFADLVGSTNLLEEHGPEAFSDLLRLYHNICTEATRGQDGTVANYLGDGVISYFGYPRGAEDEPLRAVQAAWNILHNLQAMRGNSHAAALSAQNRYRHWPGDDPPEGRRSLRRERYWCVPEQGGAPASHRDRKLCCGLRHDTQARWQGIRLRGSRAQAAQGFRAA